MRRVPRTVWDWVWFGREVPWGCSVRCEEQVQHASSGTRCLDEPCAPNLQALWPRKQCEASDHKEKKHQLAFLAFGPNDWVLHASTFEVFLQAHKESQYRGQRPISLFDLFGFMQTIAARRTLRSLARLLLLISSSCWVSVLCPLFLVKGLVSLLAFYF